MSKYFCRCQGCCDQHFGWNKECLENSEADIPEMQFTAAADTVEDVIETVETNSFSTDASESFIRPILPTFSTSDEIVTSTSPTIPEDNIVLIDEAAAFADYTGVIDDIQSDEDKPYYPVFKDGTTICQNVGTPPSWLTQYDIKGTKSECCHQYTFQWDYKDCLMRVASDAHVFAGHTTKFESRAFYPNYLETSCENDNNHPSWMVGDYLTKNDWECCSNSFSGDQDLLESCYSIPACADCPKI